MKNKKIKKLSVLYIWFMSYIVILVLVLLLSGVVYSHSLGLLENMVEENTELLLDNTRDKIDNTIYNSVELIDYLYINKDIQSLLYSDETFDMNDGQNIYDAYRSLVNVAATTNAIEEVFVYFHNQETLLSLNGHMSANLFYELYYENSEFSYEEFIEYLSGDFSLKYDGVKNGLEKEFWMLSGKKMHSAWSNESTIVVRLSTEYIMGVIEDGQYDNSWNIIIALPNGEMLGTLSKEDAAMIDDLPSDWYKNNSEVVLGNEIQTIQYQNSEISDLVYISLYSYDAIAEDAHGIQMIMIIGFFICSIIGVVFAYVMAKFNYRSLRKSMNQLGDYKSKELEMNEFEWLEEESGQMLATKLKLERQNEINEQLLVQQSIHRLITLSSDLTRDMVMEHIPKELIESESLLVGLLSTNTIQTNPYEFRKLLNSAYLSISDSKIKASFSCLGDCFGIIFYSEEEITYKMECLEESLGDFAKFIQKNHQIETFISLGEVVEDVSEINESYKKAMETSVFANYNEINYILWYEEIKSASKYFEYSLEQEDKLIRMVEVGNAEDANKFVKSIIVENMKRSEIADLRLLFLEMYGSLIRMKQKVNDTYREDEIYQDMLRCQMLNSENGYVFFAKKIDELCEKVRERQNLIKSDKKLSKRIKEYIDAEYASQDLNISTTALHFKLSPSYLSTLYKEETGSSLLDCINTVRIEHAIELLKTQESITDIAVHTGFTNSGSFIRTFKKYMGITPGQYRLNNDN